MRSGRDRRSRGLADQLEAEIRKSLLHARDQRVDAVMAVGATSAGRHISHRWSSSPRASRAGGSAIARSTDRYSGCAMVLTSRHGLLSFDGAGLIG